MKILFLIPTLQNDGAERAMSNITTHLPPNVEADILINSVSENDYPTNAKIINLGMTTKSNKNLLYQIRAMLRRIPKLYNLKKNNGYDACISFMDSANICNIISGRKYCKTIVSVRMNIAESKTFAYRWIVCPLAKLMYNKADNVVAVSKGVGKTLVSELGIRHEIVKTITNGYDIDEIREQAKLKLNEDLKLPRDKFIFVMLGRYSYEKAQWHLIRAFREVVKQCGKNVHLLLIGKGNEEEYLKTVIYKNNLGDFVTLMSYQKNPFSVLMRCNVFVMPSMFEGYCNALCEALICGLPCIATDFQSSAREILAPDTSIEYQIMDGIEYAEYGILTPVCSGIRYKGDEPLEKPEQYLSKAMISVYEDKELLENYKLKADERASQLDINKKVQDWIKLAEN